jgi:hypothetical protein
MKTYGVVEVKLHAFLTSALGSRIGRGKVVLYLLKHHAMKTYGVVKVKLHAFLTSALDGGEWSASRPDPFTPGKDPGTHVIGGWLGPRAGLDAVVKRRNPYFCRESKPSRPARSLITILAEVRWLNFRLEGRQNVLLI